MTCAMSRSLVMPMISLHAVKKRCGEVVVVKCSKWIANYRMFLLLYQLAQLIVSEKSYHVQRICRILFIVCASLIWSNQEISEFTTLYMRQAFLIIHTFVDCFYVEIQVK